MTHPQLSRIFALVLCLSWACLACAGTASSAITISVYAPEQAESPLHVSKIQYNVDGVQMVVSNASGKDVVGVAILGVAGVPRGCKVNEHGYIGVGGSVFPLTIRPHESALTSGNSSPFNTASLVMAAKHSSAGGFLHVQVGIVEADFADGTKWIWKPNLRREEVFGALFDPSLLDADGQTCTDISTMSKALEEFNGRVRYDPRFASPSPAGEDGATGLPQVLFSCRFDGSEAVCPGR